MHLYVFTIHGCIVYVYMNYYLRNICMFTCIVGHQSEHNRIKHNISTYTICSVHTCTISSYERHYYGNQIPRRNVTNGDNVSDTAYTLIYKQKESIWVLATDLVCRILSTFCDLFPLQYSDSLQYRGHINRVPHSLNRISSCYSWLEPAEAPWFFCNIWHDFSQEGWGKKAQSDSYNEQVCVCDAYVNNVCVLVKCTQVDYMTRYIGKLEFQNTST